MDLQKRLTELREEIKRELQSALIEKEFYLAPTEKELHSNLFEHVSFSVYFHGVESAERAREIMKLMGIDSVRAIEAANMKDLMWLEATDEPFGVHIITFYPKGEK